MESHLIKTKLNIPSIAAGLVPKSKALKKLDKSKTHKLTTVSASPGSGKTTLLSEWARHCRSPVAWISLDRADNDPARFCTYLAASLQTRHPAIKGAVLGMLQGLYTPPIEAILSVLLNEVVGEPVEWVLILDDYHEISNPEIHDGLSFLLHHSPPRFHLIVASRSAIPFSVGRLRVQRQLNELKAEDLYFNIAEAEFFLNTLMHLGVPPEAVRRIHERTEGWVAGLQMAALAIGENRIPQDSQDSIASVCGTHTHLSDFFMEEVIGRQPERIQSFLLETSILERMCGPLCDAVLQTTGSGQLLREICKANLFVVPLDAQGEWYRYHHLFAELLASRQSCGAERRAALHLRASQWFETHALIDEAIQHAIHGQQLERVVDLLEKYGPEYLYRGKRKTFCRWFEMLPEEVIRRNIIFTTIHAWIIYPEKSPASFKLTHERMRDAERLFKQHDPQVRISKYFTNRQVWSFIAALKAMVAREGAEPPQSVIAFCKEAVESLGDEDRTLKGTVLLNAGITHIITGDLDTAERIIDDVAVLEDRSANFYATACAAYFKAWIALVRGRMAQAETICTRTLAAITSYAQVTTPIVDCLTIFSAHIRVEHNDLETADVLLMKGIESMRLAREWGFLLKGLAALVRLKMATKEPVGAIIPLIDEISAMEGYRAAARMLAASLRMRLLMAAEEDRGKGLAEAEACVKAHGIELSFFPLQKNHFQYAEWHLAAQFALARLMIDKARLRRPHHAKTALPAVLTYLEKRLKQQMKMGLVKNVIEIHLLKALAFEAGQDVAQAVHSLKEALVLAEADRYVRLFVEAGEPMKRLLRTAAAQGIAVDYIRLLLDAFRREASVDVEPHSFSAFPSPDLLTEPLSRRELEVLRLVAAGLSNREIANHFFISEGTVKKHNYNIFRKLQVTRRTQAIAKVKHAGLI